VQTFNGVVTCRGCDGQGRFNDVECPKCKATGKAECKAKGCAGEVAAPTFESFAEAFVCDLCRGKGTLLRHVAFACPECLGVGLVLQPRADPSKTLR
jgi:RecJ-like exonuclease